MTYASIEISRDDINRMVFDLLSRTGPLAPGQISVELLLPRVDVVEALTALQGEGLVEPRANEDRSVVDERLRPWGLRQLI